MAFDSHPDSGYTINNILLQFNFLYITMKEIKTYSIIQHSLYGSKVEVSAVPNTLASNHKIFSGSEANSKSF